MPTVATSLLDDVSASIQTTAAGDNGLLSPTYLTSTVVSLDKYSYDESVTTSDHSGGQDFMEMHRITKGTFTLTLDFKYGGVGTTSMAATPLSALRAGNRVKVTTANALVAALGRVVEGIVTKASYEYGSPSTGSITIMPYGVNPA